MRRRSGFTLIEMMIVLAIIAALAATLVPIAMNALNQAKVTQNLTDLESIRYAAMQYYYKNDTGLSGLSVLDDLDTAGFIEMDNFENNIYTLNGTPTTNSMQVLVSFNNASLAKALMAQYPETSETTGTTTGDVNFLAQFNFK